MSNPKTAEEWKTAAAEYQARLDKDLADQVVAKADLERARIAKADARAALDASTAATGPGSPETKELRAKFNAANRVELAADREVTQYKQLILADKENIAYANAQAEKAQTGAPDTSTNTPPANPQPGNNTEASPQTPTPVIQNENPAATGVETGAVVPPKITTDNPVVPTAVTITPTPLVENRIPRDVPLDPNRPVTLEEIRARGPVSITGLPPAEVQTAQIVPNNIKTISTTIPGQDEFGDLEGAIAKQKNADAYQDEFTGVDEAIAQQKTIDINTSGLPVQAEDGTVASGVLINPETGQTYYTGLQGARTNAQSESTAQNQANFAIKEDWRVRLSLAPNSGYLYNALNVQGILQPLITTNGVVFPYTPNIQIQYSAHYDNYDLIHSNYKIYQYKNSSVDTVTISCDFTAQDTAEANYLLAVIHFFKSVTKMFYGQDSIPKIGTPPPLCFLSGLGSFQFDNHPLVITNFAYNLPTDVDYIRSSASVTTVAGVNKSPAQEPNNTNAISDARLAGNGGKIGRGGVTPNPNFSSTTSIQTPSASSRTPTYVPTKMSLTITANPIVTRNDISNRFSLRDYATGKLLQGKQNATVGIW